MVAMVLRGSKALEPIRERTRRITLQDFHEERRVRAIERYETCPLKFKLSRDWRIPEEPHAAMLYGGAMHLALRELPSSHRLPFWAYSTIGGDASTIGGPQPLRGFGIGRFTDVDSVSASVELRRIIVSMHAFATSAT